MYIHACTREYAQTTVHRGTKHIGVTAFTRSDTSCLSFYDAQRRTQMEQVELHFMDTVSLMKRDKWCEYTETDKMWSFAF